MNNDKNLIVKWNSILSRISIFPLLKDKNISITEEFAHTLWPKNKDIILKNIIINHEKGEINFVGEFKNKKLSLFVSPVKIDLTINPKESVDLITASLMTIGTYDEAVTEINNLSEIWFKQENFPPIRRIAFGIDLINKVNSRDDAYKAISQFLPFRVDAKISSDFKYQINNFTTSKIIESLKINRLTEFNTIKLNLRLVIADQPSQMFEDTHYCRLVLDINTDESFLKELNKDKILGLYQELVSHAEKITKEGIK